MSEAMAALWAALIGALAALLVGGFAFVAALKQVTKTAYTQRQQAFWQLRRDSYANFLLSYSAFTAAADDCFKSLAHNAEVTDAAMRKMDDAASELANMAAILDLEAPDDGELLGCVADVKSGVFEMHRFVRNWRDRVSGLRSRDPVNVQYHYEYQAIGARVAAKVNWLRGIFRADLHDEMER
jgi:hypothetical protein